MDNAKITQLNKGLSFVFPLDLLTRFPTHSLHTLAVQETHVYIHIKCASRNSNNSSNSKHPFSTIQLFILFYSLKLENSKR